MRPSDPNPKPFFVCDSSGAPVTGLVTGNFTFSAIHVPFGGSPGTWTHGAVVVAVGAGWYIVTFALPPTAGTWQLQVIHATYVVTPFGWEDELEHYDIDSIASLISRPIVRQDAAGTIGEQVSLRPIIAYRKAVIVIGVLDAEGEPAPIDTDYVTATWKVGFRDQANQNATPPKLDAAHNAPAGFGLVITPGQIAITIPDDCAIFAAMTEGATPLASLTIDMEVTAENPANQTCCIIAPSSLVINKRAEGSGT